MYSSPIFDLDPSPKENLHPLALYFLNKVEDTHPNGPGFLANNIDITTKEFVVDQSYIIAAEKTSIKVGEILFCKEDGLSCFSGRDVEIRSPELDFLGSKDGIVYIVAIDRLSIKTEDLKANQLVLILLEDTVVEFEAKNIPEITLIVAKFSSSQRPCLGECRSIRLISSEKEFQNYFSPSV